MSCRAVSAVYVGFFLCFTFGCICRAESCDAKTYADHTTYYLNENVPESQDYMWKVKGVVVAHEGDFNKTLVLEGGPRYITLKACSEDVTYMIGSNAVEIKCTHKCPEKQTTEDLPSAAVAVPAAVASVVAVLFTVIIIACYWKKLKQWFKAQRERFCSTYIPGSPADVETVIE